MWSTWFTALIKHKSGGKVNKADLVTVSWQERGFGLFICTERLPAGDKGVDALRVRAQRLKRSLVLRHTSDRRPLFSVL